jgi:hypothetical protein
MELTSSGDFESRSLSDPEWLYEGKTICGINVWPIAVPNAISTDLSVEAGSLIRQGSLPLWLRRRTIIHSQIMRYQSTLVTEIHAEAYNVMG